MMARNKPLELLSIVILGLAVLCFLIGLVVWFRGQQAYLPAIRQLETSLSMRPSLVASFFINTSPFIALIPILITGGALVWRELKQQYSPVGLGLNTTFLGLAMFTIWGADASLRGSILSLVNDLSK